MSPDRFVAIDIETTGLDPRGSEIIEFGAARVEAGRVTGRFERLARPSGPLPAAIIRLTGLTDRELASAPEPGLALAEFLEFLGQDPLVAHNADFEAGFLRAASGGRFKREILDSLELARIALPAAPGHSLGKLAALLGLEHGRLHRALADAELGARLWCALLGKLGELPPPVLSEMGWVLGPVEHPLKKIIAEAEPAAAPGEPEYARLFRTVEPPRREEAEPGEPPELDPDRLAAGLAAGGAVAGQLPGHEERPQQLEMCRRVAAALGAGRHLAVEAGTGVGKSLAYLVPAAAWTASGRRRVVVSTNTKNLQSQLFTKDLPLLGRALGAPLNAALIKGRRNYLCLRKLLYVLREAAGELDGRERGAILPVLVWAAGTETGDVAECGPLFLPGARDLIEKLTTDGPDCLGRACPQRRKCFLLRARARAQAARIIVANHALVFAELASENPVLPRYEEIVLDEAHNLEAAATRHLSVRIWSGRFYRALNRLFRFRRRSGRRRKRGAEAPAGTGLLPSLLEQAGRARSRGRVAGGFLDRLEKGARAASQGVVESVDALQAFLAALSGLFSGAPRRDKLRYSAADRRADLWAAPAAAKEELIARLSALGARVARLDESLLEDPEAERFPRREELARDLAACVERLRELVTDLEFAVKGEDEGYVFWAELAGRNRDQPELWCAPLEVAPFLAEQVYGRKRSCILSSATMTVAGRFDYLAGRLGLDRVENVETLLLGTPFDFSKQARVLLPAWLPEPGTSESGRNSVELAGMLAGLCRATRGRALVLFTSYGALDEVYRELGPLLEPEGIVVLGQGRDGSREQLLAALQEEKSAVLLGTSSFWEGVDVRGPALSCLVLARLPFQVYTEPLFRARAGLVESRGQGAFMNYSLPEAVLRFRQGFGRLIRSKTDRGIAVLADRRLVTKRYGRVFLQSLPCGHRVLASSEQLTRAAGEFFGG